MSRKILVIEDQSTMRRNVALMLELEGHLALALTAADGLEGIQTARRERPDLALCDVTMPGMDGHAGLAACARMNRSGIPPSSISPRKARSARFVTGSRGVPTPLSPSPLPGRSFFPLWRRS